MMMRKGKGGGGAGGGANGRSGLLPNSLRIISSCLKTVSSNAGSVASTVRSAGASVAASISVSHDEEKDQVLWASFDKLELQPSSFKRVLLIGYCNGFHVFDVDDASNIWELVSKRDGPVTFLQMQPIPEKSDGCEGFKASHPLLLVVAGDETNGSHAVQSGRLSALISENSNEAQPGSYTSSPTVVRFFSLKSHSYVHVLRFRSAVYMVRCSPRIVAVALAAQIYCFDAVTLENKFSVLTYPLQGTVGVNVGYGPMAIGPRWLAYASNNPLLSNTGRVSPQNLSPSPGVSPSTSPSGGSLVARYAMESSKHLAAGILNLGDMGYKTLSKYRHDFLPDGSNSFPLSSSSSRKLGRLSSTVHSSDADNAGMVVVKDFVTKDVISQFRAHNSPISALCFDPSGTLLVTASVHGHNINVFRIMPTFISNGTSLARFDWTASHVHLYKLYRGITSAVIQDICFSHYSQWIAIVSSRGTCHIFVLSPFGGEAGLQMQSPHYEGPVLIPNLTSPWWSSSSLVDQQCFPPPPITLSVVNRIKNSNTGWLNTVSSVASSAAGKMQLPSGAIASVFHNSLSCDDLAMNLKPEFLEHLLVYSPSGYLIQHKLVPSSLYDSCDIISRTGAAALHVQDDEVHVNAEPVQWWDVCRRSNWPEREESISRILDKKFSAETNLETFNEEATAATHLMSSNNNMTDKESAKTHWYLSNAEVQINSGKIPLWQKSKICFYVLTPSRTNGDTANNHSGGEVEIERLPSHEIEIRRKDLLPVFEQFHCVQSDRQDRGFAGRISQASSCEASQAVEKDYRNSAHFNSLAPSRLHSGRSLSLQPVGQTSDLTANSEIEDARTNSISVSPKQVHGSTLLPDKSCNGGYDRGVPIDSSALHCLLDTGNGTSYIGMPPLIETQPWNESMCSDISSPCIATSNAPLEHAEGSDSNNSVEFARYFHDDGYCKASELDDCRELPEAVTDPDSGSSHCEREKPEEDGDDMLGVFAFSSEEG